MNRIGWSIALIFAAVLALYLPSLLKEDEPEVNTNQDMELVPNYQAVNLRSKIYDEDGRLSHRVVADKMEHYEELAFTVFENPVYTLYLKNGEPWQLSADEGVWYENNRIKLENNVTLVSLHPQKYINEISAEFMEIDLKDQTLKSDQLVTISGSNFIVTSIGIAGNLASQQYELKEHVKTKFDPNQPSL